MREQLETPIVGSQYLVHGRIMEVIHADEELVTLRDLECTYTRSLAVDAMMTELSHQTILPFARPPGAGSKSLAFLNPQDPHVKAAERQYRYVSTALQQLGGSLPVKATEALIQQLSHEIGDPKPPCYNSLYKWSKHYKNHNCDHFSLLKEQSIAPRGKHLAPDVETVIQDMIEQEYLKSPPSGPKTIQRYVHGQIVLMNRLREGYSSLLLKTPSLSTIQRRIKKLCARTSDIARFGSNYAKKKHDSSKQSVEPEEILDLAEIDSHLIDMVIIDESGKPLGKILLVDRHLRD